MKQWVGACALTLLVAGCGEPESVSVSSQAIIDGTASGLEDDAVVELLSPGGRCTATLIAPNLVMTARHCISIVNRSDGLACNLDGTSVNDKGLITQDYEASEIAINLGPGSTPYRSLIPTKLISTGSPTVCRNDLALAVLAEPVDGMPFLPIRLLRPTDVGELVTLVGYGATGNAEPVSIRRRRAGVEVLRVGPNRFNEQGGQAVRGTFVVTQGACAGDSGGPAIAESTGAVAGVYSIKSTEDCASPSATGVYVQIAEYYELVLQAFDEAGVEPWLEGEAAPTEGEVSQGCAVRRPEPAGYALPFLVWGGLLVVGVRRRSGRRNAVVR